MISLTLFGPFPYDASLMSPRLLSTFLHLFELNSNSPFSPFRLTMGASSSTFSSLLPWLATTLTFVCRAPTPHNKMARLNAHFAPSLMLFTHFSFMLTYHFHIRLKLLPLQLISLTDDTLLSPSSPTPPMSICSVPPQLPSSLSVRLHVFS